MNRDILGDVAAGDNGDDSDGYDEYLWTKALYGTWTFTTQTMTDVGYYKGRSYFIMHLMPNPLRKTEGCHIHSSQDDFDDRSSGGDSCSEYNNRLCMFNDDSTSSERKRACVDTQSTVVDWSDAVAFFQFGVQLRTGIAWKSYIFSNTSDWLGPYNLVMAQDPKKTTKSRSSSTVEDQVDDEDHLVEDGRDLWTPSSSQFDVEEQLQSNVSVQHRFHSRYVTTHSTLHELRRPVGSNIITPEAFDTVAGPAAVNHTIFVQNGKPMSSTGQDPYAAYAGTCDHGDIQPILPQLQMRISTEKTDPHHIRSVPHFQVEYSILSTPDKKQDKTLYNLWPSLKKHLGSEFPLTGPYCYGNDAKRAYTVRLSYDSRDPVRNNTWQVVKGCVQGLPCWDDGGEGPVIPYDNGESGIHAVDPTGMVALICYLLGFLLVISLIFNVQLSNQLKRIQGRQEDNSSPSAATTSRIDTTTTTTSRRLYSREGDDDARTDLEEPLLPPTDNQGITQEQHRSNQIQFSSSAFDALDPNSSEPLTEDSETGDRPEETNNDVD
mmetsp:Transcript_5732/g.13954  ORF Transcript_5732/g.13954 Transcript_5732/m.13954 type:complete len:547 (-) Transcript_5732:59-1699(-)